MIFYENNYCNRLFGVDAQYVYNAKRGQEKDGRVHRAQRKISHIQQIDVMDNDPCAFFIKWIEEGKDLNTIEYICENARACADIVTKIKYIIAHPPDIISQK